MLVCLYFAGDPGEKGNKGDKGEDGVGIKGSSGAPGKPRLPQYVKTQYHFGKMFNTNYFGTSLVFTVMCFSSKIVVKSHQVIPTQFSTEEENKLLMEESSFAFCFRCCCWFNCSFVS